MDKEIFVQNVKYYCSLKQTTPTVACRESGAGKDMMTNLTKRGTAPSIERVKLLADYLGCTVGELLGEQRPADDGALVERVTPAEQQLLELFRTVPQEKRDGILLAVETALRSQGLL